MVDRPSCWGIWALGNLGTVIPKLLKINDFFLKLPYFIIDNFLLNDLILAHYGQNEVRTVKIFRGTRGPPPKVVSPRIFMKYLW